MYWSPYVHIIHRDHQLSFPGNSSQPWLLASLATPDVKSLKLCWPPAPPRPHCFEPDLCVPGPRSVVTPEYTHDGCYIAAYWHPLSIRSFFIRDNKMAHSLMLWMLSSDEKRVLNHEKHIILMLKMSRSHKCSSFTTSNA